MVAKLTAINDSKYSSMSEVEFSIRRQLLNDKKFDIIASQLSGSSMDQKAASLSSEVASFEGVNFNSYYVNGLGLEPRVIGSICSSNEGVVSEAVKGANGLYVFEVDSITESEEPLSAESEKVRGESMAVQMTQQMLFMALESMADVKDLRGKTL